MSTNMCEVDPSTVIQSMQRYPRVSRFVGSMTTTPVFGIHGSFRKYKETSMLAIISNARICRLQQVPNFLSPQAFSIIEEQVLKMRTSSATFLQFWNWILQPIVASEFDSFETLHQLTHLHRLIEIAEMYGLWPTFVSKNINPSQLALYLKSPFQDYCPLLTKLNTQLQEYIASDPKHQLKQVRKKDIVEEEESMNLSFEAEVNKETVEEEKTVDLRKQKQSHQLCEEDKLSSQDEIQISLAQKYSHTQKIHITSSQQDKYLKDATARLKTFQNVKELFYDICQAFQLKIEDQTNLFQQSTWVSTVSISREEKSFVSALQKDEKKDFAKCLAMINILEEMFPLILKCKLEIHKMDLQLFLASKGRFGNPAVSQQITQNSATLKTQQQTQNDGKQQQQQPENVNSKRKKNDQLLAHLESLIVENNLNDLPLKYSDLHVTDPAQRRKVKTLLNELLQFFNQYLKHMRLSQSVDVEEGVNVSKISYLRDGQLIEKKFKIKANDTLDGHVKAQNHQTISRLLMNVEHIVHEVMGMYFAKVADVIHYLQLQ